MPLKCHTKYVSKSGKLSSGHRTGRGQFSFNPPQKQCQVIFKLPYICAVLMLAFMLARLCLKSFKQGVSSTGTENFQIYKLNLGKAEEPEIKLPTSAGSSRKQESSRKISTSVSLTTLKPLTVWITTNHGKCLKRWEC